MRRTLLPLVFVLLAAEATAAPGRLPFGRGDGGPRRLGFDLPELQPRDSLEEVYVVPRRAGQNQVRWYGFDFKELLLPQLPGAGVRLFYPESTTPAAEVAAAAIREQYLRLARAFEYVPEREIPYILYGTHFEFQATNVFPISEGVLGATSPADLTLALPFFGDLQQFRHTSTHELVHEFTIQAVKSYGEAAGKTGAIGGFPLWFIEGLAEYASYGGIDPDARPGPNQPLGADGPSLPGLDAETEAWARDLLYQAAPFEGYLIPPFYSDLPRSYVHTYKLGQLRVAFLGSTFGRETILWLLRNSHHMGGGAPGFGAVGGTNFAGLVSLATGHDENTIERMFTDWLQRRYLPVYGEARTRVPAVGIIDDLDVEPESLYLSPDGKVLLLRGFERQLGRASIWLMDAANPRSAQMVVQDGSTRVQSLHLMSRRTFAVGANRIAWIGRRGPADVLTVARIERNPPDEEERYRIHDEREWRLWDVGIIEAGDPTFSPDGTRLAFAAVGEAGFKDVWILDLEGDSQPRKLTDTPWGESGLYWSEEGIHLASDATPDGDSNLFLMDPDSGELRPTIADSSDKETPLPTSDGLLFASDRGGRWDVHRLEKDGKVYRLTDVPTQLRYPVPGPNGTIYGILVHAGRFRLAQVPPAELQRLEARPPIEEGYDGTPRQLSRLGLPADAPDYEPFDHFGIDIGALAVGTQSVAVGGLSFSDLLRDKIVAVRLAVYGDLDFTDGSAIYMDRSRRLAWLAGVYHQFQPKRDRTFDEPPLPNDSDFYLERQFGALGGVSYPFDRFRRMDLIFNLEGVDRSRFTDDSGERRAEWEELTGGSEPQAGATLGFGLDTLRYHPWVGPIAGTSALLSVGGNVLPQRLDEDDAWLGFVELDLQHWFYLGSRTTIWTRAALGSGFGGRFSRQFYLSSVDNLRGYHWADERLLGTNYYVANVELSFPLDWLMRVAILEGMRAVGGADFGGVTDDADLLWDVRSLNLVAGLDFLLGPLALRLHFGYPIQIGPQLPSDEWVTNFALRLRY